MRLFFAAPLPDKTRRIVADAVAACPACRRPWRWIPPENYHLTLKFLGDAPPETAHDLARAAGRAVAGLGPVEVRYGAFGAFPSLERPRVLVYGITAGEAELGRIAAAIDDAAASLGFPRERRRFRAHLTLARVRRPLSPETIDALRRMPDLPPGAAHVVDRVLLVSSRLEPDGARYEAIAACPLGGAP